MRSPGSFPATLALEWLFYSAPLLLVHGYVVRLAYMTPLFGQFGGSQFIYFQF